MEVKMETYKLRMKEGIVMRTTKRPRESRDASSVGWQNADGTADRELIRKGHELKAQERKGKSVCFLRER